jgi:hypothetical protein
VLSLDAVLADGTGRVEEGIAEASGHWNSLRFGNGAEPREIWDAVEPKDFGRSIRHCVHDALAQHNVLGSAAGH